MNEYRVLANKYRPQKFSDLIGQEALVNIISNSIKKNRIAHAYILTGVRGVGKTTTARIIAMSLNCQKKTINSFEPCGECSLCKTIRTDQNLDVIEMDAASKTGVNDIRDIIDNIKYKPVESTYKVFIIDEVHMLSINAFNALLKTLEEPPEHVKFIFATTEVNKIPITVLSRCQRFDLKRIDNSVLSEHLSKISNLENVSIEKDALALIVRAADGSVRDGLSILDQAIANNSEKINTNIVSEMLGLADRAKIFDLLDFIFNGNVIDSIRIYNELYKSGADIIMIFDEMLNAVHFITQIKISPSLKDDVYTPEIERSKGFEISQKLSMPSLGVIWQVLFKGFSELQNSLHLHQHGEMIILRLIYINSGPSPEELLKKIKIKENETKSKEKNNVNTVESINQDNDVKQSKNLIVEKISSVNDNYEINIASYRKFADEFYKNREAILHTKLYNDVKLISFKEGEVILNTTLIKDPHFNRNIAKLISKWTGRIWQVHSSDSNIGRSLNEEDMINQQKEIEKIKNNPRMKKILDNFPGSLVHSITELTETNDENKFQNNIKKEKESEG